MASNDLGYERERFTIAVNPTFHCLICFNVLNDPVMCQRNQHCYCRGCITQHLNVNASRCPTCAEGLTVATLTDAPRMVKDYLSELPIHCDYQDRGCEEIIQLQHLGGHVAECGFKPVVCANQGCGITISQRDRLRHESEQCEHRPLPTCHNCDEMSKTMAVMQSDLAKLQTNMESVAGKVGKTDSNIAKMEKNVAIIERKVAKMEVDMNYMQMDMAALNTKLLPTIKTDIEKLQSNSDKSFQAVTKEVKELRRTLTYVDERYENLKESLLERMKGLENAYKKQEERTSETSDPSSSCKEEQYIMVAGGIGESSVEIYEANRKSWSLLQSMPGKRFNASSFVYKNHLTVAGGYCSGTAVGHMIRSSIYPKPDPSAEWKAFSGKLPRRLAGHSSVLFNDSLFVAGGWNEDDDTYSKSIYEVQLVPPYNIDSVAEMAEAREGHCTELFNDNIFIFGGNQTGRNKDKLRSVEVFNIATNECRQTKPLPYPVADMATVKWADNVLVIGGTDLHGKVLNSVIVYNIKSFESNMLPPMKYKRKGCTAVVLGNSIVVMGGADDRENISKSVEVFSFERYSWDELSEMKEARYGATAVVI